MRAGLAEYMAANGFNPAYDDRWVKLRAGPLVMIFPSTGARVAAARLHDLHHLLNSYDTNWTGEAEIAAWELGGGCARHWPAWTLNLGAFVIGLVTRPRRVYRAFVRGRRGRNLYRYAYSDALLDTPIDVARERCAIVANAPAPRPADVFAFARWCAMALLWVSLAPLSALLFIVSLYARSPAGEAWVR